MIQLYSHCLVYYKIEGIHNWTETIFSIHTRTSWKSLKVTKCVAYEIMFVVRYHSWVKNSCVHLASEYVCNTKHLITVWKNSSKHVQGPQIYKRGYLPIRLLSWNMYETNSTQLLHHLYTRCLQENTCSGAKCT